MPDRSDPTCSQREATEALAHDALRGDARHRAAQHLERCEQCRTGYRQITGGWFPHFDSYTVVERIAEGGFGVVYKAVHHAKERTEALKVLYARSARGAAYFENEVHLIAGLQHPNIATLYEAQLSKPPLYYTMELVEGERLNEYLHSHAPSLAERINIVKIVAEAVSYANGKNVVHRDLKPQNILVDAEGQPHIVDFGISKRLGLSESAPGRDDSPPGSPEGAIGTLGYIAPEQEAGVTVDARADVYALGGVLFNSATGESPRLAADGAEVCRLLRERGVSRPEDLAAIIAHSRDPDPQRRYPSCAALADDLGNYLDERPVAARSERSFPYRATRVAGWVVRKHPYAVRAAVLATAAVMLTAIFASLGTHWFAAPLAAPQTVLVGFDADTLDALRAGRLAPDLPELNPWYYKSWRLLHARLLRQLAQAKPRVIAWDYFFPDCQPEYDDDFIRAVRAADTPVVVGCDKFDINGEPLMCPHIRAAVYGAGAIVSTRPDTVSGQFDVPVCILRGFEEPIPSLAVTAFAAASFSDARARFKLAGAKKLLLHYQRREFEPGQSRWHETSHDIPIHRIVTPRELTEHLDAGDRVARMRMRAADPEDWADRIIPYHQVLSADADQLREWFDGRAVMVGQMLPNRDEHALAGGQSVFGCQVQAQALDTLLRRDFPGLFTREEISLRIVIWCLTAGLLAGAIPLGGRFWRRAVTPACIALTLAGLALAIYAAAWVTKSWGVEAAVAASALLTAGSLALLARAAHERRRQLAPENVILSGEPATLPDAALAETESTQTDADQRRARCDDKQQAVD